MVRSIVYIDVFNFYYGLLRSGKYKGCKWLDLEGVFKAIRQHDEIRVIRYFTAFWPDESGERHKVYAGALSQLPIVDVRAGRYKKKSIRCQVRECRYAGNRVFRSYEEKETDVSIALAMLDDAYQKKCEAMILVTADSDLVPAINLVKDRFPDIRIIAYIPGPHKRFQTAIHIRTACDDSRLFPANLLPKFQLPQDIVADGGRTYRKPSQW